MLGNILKYSWRNTWRNSRRTLLTLLALAVAVLCLIFADSYITGFFGSTSEAVIKTQTGHVRLADKEYLRLERIMPKEHMIPGLTDLKKAIHELPGVNVVSVVERIKFNVMLSHNDANEAALAQGIDPVPADKSMGISPTIVEGRYLSGDGLEALVGKKLAEKLKVGIGDELLLVTTDINYSTYALPFKIVGMFETGFGALDKRTLYIPVNKAREMLDCGDSAHELLVYLDDANASGAAATAIRNIPPLDNAESTIDVTPWDKTELIETSLPMMKAIFGKIMSVIMIIAAMVILNTMLMTVMERYHEIGVIKALGFKNHEVFIMILAEAFYLGAIGSVVGGIFGGGLSAYYEKVGFDMAKMSGGLMEKLDIPIPVYGKMLYTDLTPEILISGIIFGIVISLAAVIYPAVKSMRMQPVEAFRSQLKV